MPLSSARAEAVWDVLAQDVHPGSSADVAVEETFGRVLAEGVLCKSDYPPFDRAVMDGFAVRSSGFASDTTVLIEGGSVVRAGGPEGSHVESGTCLQINTGAPIPPGADAIVIVEDSRRLPFGRVELRARPSSGENIERRASIRASGAMLLARGARIAGGEAAALISGGVESVRVYDRPSVALFTTGDELAPRGAAPQQGQIPESNSVALRPMIAARGARVAACRQCPDDEAALRDALTAGLNHDVLIVTGGMSKGSHDLVPGTLETLGVRWLVTSLDLKPGKPTRIGRGPNGCWVLGLPGNPVSSAVCFLLFGRPILDGLQGIAVRPPPFLRGRLDRTMPGNGARPMFQPAAWRLDADGEIRVEPLAWHGSGDPFGLSGANALVHRLERVSAAAVGDAVRFLPIELPL